MPLAGNNEFSCQVNGAGQSTAGLKSGQFDGKRDFGLAELIKKRISNIES
jgi:hypothetical protein